MCLTEKSLLSFSRAAAHFVTASLDRPPQMRSTGAVGREAERLAQLKNVSAYVDDGASEYRWQLALRIHAQT